MQMQTSAEATKADASDRAEILHAIGLYVDGFNDGDASKFTEAFHEDAWIFYTDAEGRLHRQLIAEAFDAWAAERRPITGRILCVTQAGDIASVLLDFDDADEPTNRWVDLHALVRVAGVWKITNKTATHRSRAGRSVV
jgi:ketosteroid isomerase-like protein